MSATFWKFLVFNVTSRQPSALKFANCPRHIFRSAKTGIGINNRRNVHGVDDVSGQLRYLGQGKQTNIRHARRCIREAGPTNVNCIEAGTFHLSGHDRIRHAGHCHTALGNEFPKPARLTLLHYFFLPTLSLARARPVFVSFASGPASRADISCCYAISTSASPALIHSHFPPHQVSTPGRSTRIPHECHRGFCGGDRGRTSILHDFGGGLRGHL